jgi:hypothetical protein
MNAAPPPPPAGQKLIIRLLLIPSISTANVSKQEREEAPGGLSLQSSSAA